LILLKIVVVVLVVLGVVKIVDILRKKDKRADQRKTDTIEESTFVECKVCKTFVDKDEAIISSSGYFCSKECLERFGQ